MGLRVWFRYTVRARYHRKRAERFYRDATAILETECSESVSPPGSERDKARGNGGVPRHVGPIRSNPRSQ
jgi:hypothetical protein